MIAFPLICCGFFFLGDTAKEKSDARNSPCQPIHQMFEAPVIVCCFTLAFCLFFGLGWPEVRKNTMWPEAECSIIGSTVRTYADCYSTAPVLFTCNECYGRPSCTSPVNISMNFPFCT